MASLPNTPGRREHVLDGQQTGLSNEQRHGLGSRQGILGLQEPIVEIHAFIVDFQGCVNALPAAENLPDCDD